jgi:aspartate dehydrogenase
VSRLVREGHAGSTRIVGALVREPPAPGTADIATVTTAVELLELRPAVVVEAAGHAAIRAHARDVLEAGVDLILLSVGALADDAFRAALIASAEGGRARLLVPSGAVGGLDALAAARSIGLERVTHTIRKSPSALGLSPEDDQENEQLLLEGTARTVATAYPANANVVAAIAFAGIGLDATRVRVIADPSLSRNVHEIRADGAFGELEVRIVNEPLADNPRSSALAAGSVAAALARRGATFAII